MFNYSLIFTLKNEEKNIYKLLESIVKQTVKPDEIIICDAGSTDNTLEILENFKKSNPNLMISIIKEKGVNRSKGRNEAIKQAKGVVIIVTDAGCVPDENWIKNIIEPFNDINIDVVAGYYKPITKTIFQKCLACYTSVMEDKVDPNNFLPSSRSIAFKKTAWEKVGGYPEKLDYCEDLVFAVNLKKAGLKFQFKQDAIVYWPQKENIIQAFWQFFHYAYGDGQALYMPHVKNITFVYFRYLIGIMILYNIFIYDISIYHILFWGGLLLYITWSIIKNYRYIKNLAAFCYLPILQFTADLAVMLGFFYGITRRKSL
ncbi:MAG: glycosyltransferase [Candidatus Gottesmanbacteria bacterium]